MFCKQYISQQELVNNSLKWLLWIIFMSMNITKQTCILILTMHFTRTGCCKALRMPTSGLTHLWTMTFKHVAFPLLTSYVMIKWVRGSSGEDENERWPWMSAKFDWSACCLWDLSFFYVHSTSKHDNTGIFFYVHGTSKHDNTGIYAVMSETCGSN